uniref:BRCT domain-containing protein n=1 Tax=Pelusios castaneus TaxID=367368 RepID=A0A8C8SR96_9SAUR
MLQRSFPIRDVGTSSDSKSLGAVNPLVGSPVLVTIRQKCNATVVTREWVLDSVACHECQKFDPYLVSQS